MGQWRIQRHGQANEKVLQDNNVSIDIKKKIQLVEDTKKYFYSYFEKPKTDIYSKTTFLETEAVTYLVIAAPHTKLEAHEFSFPFVGSFPYLGFFNKNSALKFQKDLEKDNLVTWIRPVYAYSTLGYFEDRILSSFFYFDDFELAELVFHELFHTIFFIKNEVDMNENFANFFGKEMVKIYFKDHPDLPKYVLKLELERDLESRMVNLIHLLKEEFNKLGAELTDNKSDEITKRFAQEVFVPQMMKACSEVKEMTLKCKFDQEVWNQASFAALLTYEEQQDEIGQWFKNDQKDLKSFFKIIEKSQKEFKDSSVESYLEFLQKKFKKDL